MIPIDLSAFEESEIGYIYVWNVNSGDTTNLSLDHYLFYRQFREQNWITDNPTDGVYSSDLDGSDLFFYFPLSDTSYQMLDSMTNIVIKKSKGDVDDKCYENHANVRIDQVNFEHAGKIFGKEGVVVLRR